MTVDFHIWKGFHMLFYFTHEIFSYEIRISHIIWFHIWDFTCDIMIWFHIWAFHMSNQNFTYELISHMKSSHVKSVFHMWFDFTYEGFTYEIRVSHVIWFHIWKFHTWNQHFTCEIPNSHVKFQVSHMKWTFHMWNHVWNFNPNMCHFRKRKLYLKFLNLVILTLVLLLEPQYSLSETDTY